MYVRASLNHRSKYKIKAAIFTFFITSICVILLLNKDFEEYENSKKFKLFKNNFCHIHMIYFSKMSVRYIYLSINLGLHNVHCVLVIYNPVLKKSIRKEK